MIGSLGKRFHLTSFQLIFFSFFVLIAVGTFLLMLPVSSADGTATPFLDCLFTATSASCVTGLIVHDTATYWSTFGHIVILTLIQIGGLGVITLSIIAVVISGKKISLYQRSVMQDSISAGHPGGIVRFTRLIIKSTLIFEGGGFLLLCFSFIPKFGVVKGIYYSLFHAVSAFCNAGFDLMGHYSSLTSYMGDTYVNIVIMALIVFGGLSFYTWRDVFKYRQHFSRYSMQSKVILFTSAFLILVPAVIFFFSEYAGLPMKERILASFFQSVTTRTAGFNTTDQAALSEPGLLLTVILMMIGGSPGSTAGGMKTTTAAVLIIASLAVFRRKEDSTVFKRRVENRVVRDALAILFMYFFLLLITSVIVCKSEGLPLLTCMYECASAIGTVGLTMGVTPSLHTLSRIILIGLMFFGRVGCLTLIYAANLRYHVETAKLPSENINVG